MKNWVVIILVMTVAPVLAVTAVTMLTRTVLVVKFEFGPQWVLFSLLLAGVVIHALSLLFVLHVLVSVVAVVVVEEVLVVAVVVVVVEVVVVPVAGVGVGVPSDIFTSLLSNVPHKPKTRLQTTCTRTPQGPFNGVLMALNCGYLGYIGG